MDSQVTVRFFKVEKRRKHSPDFAVACEGAFALGANPSDRERTVHSSYRLRMERFEQDGQFYCGEMVRVQTENIPPEATASGLTPLSVGGLGHAVAYRYHPGIEVMAIQFNTRAVSLVRFANYLNAIDDSFDYKFEPLVTEDAWSRYQDGSPRKLEIQIASPASLAEVEGNVGALTDSARKLGEIAEAPMIRIEISMGSKRKGALRKDFVTSALKYFTTGAGRNEDVRTLKATVKDTGEDGTSPIDFLDEKLFCRSILELPPANAEKHYAVRKAFLKSCFSEELEYITRVYGKS